MATTTVRTVKVNRAPVMALWGAVVAQRLGYNWEEALTLGQAVSVLNARSKGKRLGIIAEEKPEEKAAKERARREAAPGEERVELLGRSVYAKRSDAGLRAVIGEETENPKRIEGYLRSKFGEAYGAVKEVLEGLANSYSPEELKQVAYSLYEQFRPQVAAGQRGWGQRGELDLETIRELAKSR